VFGVGTLRWLRCESEARALVDDLRRFETIDAVQERIGAAARKVGRPSDEITLIGVSKTQPTERFGQTYKAGLRYFGENRVQ